MNVGKLHVDEYSCGLCEGKVGSSSKCCCPDDITKLKLVSEERLRKRINLKEDQKLCQYHLKKLESGLLFGETYLYQCCSPFHVDSPKKQNLKPVPHSWRSYFQGTCSNTKRYRTTQRICRECFLLAIEVMNSDHDAFEDDNADLGYHSASFDFGYVSPRQWANNLALKQRLAPSSFHGSSWSLTPSLSSTSSTKSGRASEYLRNNDPKFGLGTLRKRLYMPNDNMTSPTHSEPDIRIPTPAKSMDDVSFSKPNELDISNSSANDHIKDNTLDSSLSEEETTEYPVIDENNSLGSFETNQDNIPATQPIQQGDSPTIRNDTGIESFSADESCSRASCIRMSRGNECTLSSEKTGDMCTKSEGIYVSKYIKFIYSDKIARHQEKDLPSEDSDSGDSIASETQEPILIQKVTANKKLAADSSKYTNDVAPSLERSSKYQTSPTHGQRISRGPTFIPLLYDRDVVGATRRSIENNLLSSKVTISPAEMSDKCSKEVESDLVPDDGEMVCEIDDDCQHETAIDQKLCHKKKLVLPCETPNSKLQDPNNNSRQTISAHNCTPMSRGVATHANEAGGVVVVKKDNDEMAPVRNEFCSPKNGVGMLQDLKNSPAMDNKQIESNEGPKDKTTSITEPFIGLRKKPRNTRAETHSVVEPQYIINTPDQKVHGNRIVEILLNPVSEILKKDTTSKISDNEHVDGDNEDGISDKQQVIEKVATINTSEKDLYTELHGSKADDTEVPITEVKSILSEERDEVPEILPGAECLQDNERTRLCRRRMQNRSQSLFQEDSEDSESLARRTLSVFTSFQTDQPALGRGSIWREKRRKYGVTFKKPSKADDEKANESEEAKPEDTLLEQVENEDVSAVLSDIFETIFPSVTESNPSQNTSSNQSTIFYSAITITMLLALATFCFVVFD